MTWLRVFIHRLSGLFLRRKLERDMEDEIRSHLDMQIDDNQRQGMSPNEAQYAALRKFGGVEQVKEVYRARRGLPVVETTLQDLRYGLRMLLKHKGFTVVAVLTLALGIGANTAVFTLINALLLRPLPVKNPHELVVVKAINARDHGAQTKGGSAWNFISFPMYRDLRARQEVFTDILASSSGRSVRLSIPARTGTVELDNVQTTLVTANYWSVLGVEPALGRFFTDDEDRNPNSSETAGSLAVLSYSFWERQFGRDPGVLDRTVIVDRSPCRVIGVAARGFFGEQVGYAPDIWVPLISFTSRDVLEHRDAVTTEEVGRLKPGVSREQAQTAMTLLLQQLIQADRIQTPPSNLNSELAIQDFIIQLEPGATGLGFGHLRQTFTEPLWIIMAIVALVLLIACTNVANLLLARAVARQREISVRLALGCGRFRLVRQLLTESLLLSALGTIAGLFIAWWASHVLLQMVDTEPVPLRLDLSPDVRVLLFTSVVMVLTGIGFGLVPAWRSSSVDLVSTMKEQARGPGRSVKQYLGRTLVVFQVALSLLLLIGAGLLIRSLHNLGQIDLGFRPEQVLLFKLAHNPSDQEPAALARVAREIRERVKQIPGVERTSVSWWTLFGFGDMGRPIKIHGYTPAPNENVQPRFNSVSPDYFETVGMSLKAGRGIEERDRENAPLIAVINETMARRYFPNENAIGRIIEITQIPSVRDKPIEIVGIIRDTKFNNLRAETKPMFYASIQQLPRPLGTLEVRTREPSAALTVSIRNALLEVTKDIMIRRVVTLSAQVDQTLASERLLTVLCTFFGMLALLLASVGLYGVLSNSVAQRTQEIGIRMALGATGSNVLWLMLRQSMTIVLMGIVLGVSLTIFCTRLLAGFLYGLSPTDPVAIVFSVLLLLVVALLACYFPARRATKIDPMIALRCE
jgi:predicted permease